MLMPTQSTDGSTAAVADDGLHRVIIVGGESKGRCVPPRAQAAHQQASLMVRQVQRRLAGDPLLPYRYRDFGSLITRRTEPHVKLH